MSEGVVPDSDPLPPPLDPHNPEWVSFRGIHDPPWDDESIRDSPSIGYEKEVVADRQEDSDGSRTPPHSELIPLGSSPLLPPAETISEEAPLMDLREPASDPIVNRRPTPDVEKIHGAIEPQSPAVHIPPRKRFNFETWVRREKRAHEKVYHRRYEVFHGANSDSEDDDYGEMEAEAGQPDDPQLETFESDETEISQGGSNRPFIPPDESDAGTINIEPTAPRRSRPHIIDSESDSDLSHSDTESSVSSTNSLVPIFARRLTEAIPASRNLHSIETADSQPDSQNDSQNDFIDTHNELQQKFPKLSFQNAQLTNQTVKDVAPIDYMLSHRTKVQEKGKSRSRKLGSNYTPLSVSDLAHKAGPKASKGLLVATRTAQRTFKSRGEQPRNDNPLKKMFIGSESKDATRTLRHWRQGTLNIQKKKDTSKLRNTDTRAASMMDRENDNITRRPRSKAHEARPAVLPASASIASSDSANSRKPPRKRQKATSSRRKASEPSPSLYHTTILERQLPGRSESFGHSRSLPFPMTTKVSSRSANSPKMGRSFSSNDFGTKDKLSVAIDSPKLYFSSKRFGKSTFIGSNTLDLLQNLTLWNGEPVAEQAFGTALDKGDEAAVTKDAEYVLATCEGNQGHIEASLFDKIYDYFLLGVAYLCDERQIVEVGFRMHVYRQWLRLARSVLRMSLKRRFASTETPLVSQVVSLATVIVARRLSTLAETDFRKASLLLVWTVYYHQSNIAAQIDHQFIVSPRYCVGAELVFTGIELGCFTHIPTVFAKHSQSSGKWHLLLLLSSFHSRGWSNWELARSLVSSRPVGSTSLNPGDVRVATDYIVRLISKWSWPPSAEIIIDLFNFYAKQQHYADPRGEAIWLPEFLLKSRFDGTYNPDQDFSMFLELLGVTLSRFADRMTICRRISGRVTPLSAVSFPETKEVSLADLSSASHQYSILIVLLRMSPPESRPSVTQFRDLVVLKDAHLAIRIKAVSAWSIVSRLATDTSSAVECRNWLKWDICRDEHPPPSQLLLVSLRCAADVAPVASGAVPSAYLLEMGLRSLDIETRIAAWTLLIRMRPLDRQGLLNELGSFGGNFDHLVESDVDAFVKLIQSAPELVEKWPAPGLRPVVVAKLLDNHAMTPRHPVAQSYLLKSLLRATWTNEDKLLLRAARFGAQSEVGDRQVALRNVFSQPVSVDMAKLALDIARNEWEAAVKGGETTRLAYRAVVAQTRHFVFEHWPMLGEVNAWFDDNSIRGIELAQVNISKFVTDGKNFEGEFFFAYKLRRSLETDAGQSFTDEIVAALDFTHSGKAQKSFEFVVNGLFAFYFCVATEKFFVMEPTLPTLVRTARVAMCQGAQVQYNPAPMLHSCMQCIYAALRQRLAYDVEGLGMLVYEIFTLAYVWLQQIASGDVASLYDREIVGLWAFGKRYSDPDFSWWEIESFEVDLDELAFDKSAALKALEGVNRDKLHVDHTAVERLVERAWNAFDKLARCYENRQRDGVGEGEVKYVEDAFTSGYTERPPTALDQDPGVA